MRGVGDGVRGKDKVDVGGVGKIWVRGFGVGWEVGKVGGELWRE